MGKILLEINKDLLKKYITENSVMELDEIVKLIMNNENKKNTDKYEVDVVGEWVNREKLILNNWEVEELETETDNLYSDYRFLTYGMVFGYNHPTVIVLIGIKNGKIYILDEFYERRLTNRELIKKANDFINKKIPIIADSEPNRIEEFEEAGFCNIESYERKKDSFAKGLNFLRDRKIIINTKCVNTLKEIQNYEYEIDKYGYMFIPIESNVVKAIRYATKEFWQF